MHTCMCRWGYIAVRAYVCGYVYVSTHVVDNNDLDNNKGGSAKRTSAQGDSQGHSHLLHEELLMLLMQV